MITPINITGINYKVARGVQAYAMDKIGKLDHFVPQTVRQVLSADVKLKQVSREPGDRYDIDVVLHLPGKTLTAQVEQASEQAAIDVVQEKLIGQLRRYKTAHAAH